MSPKSKKFVEAILSGENGVNAIKKAGYGKKDKELTYNTAGVMANEYLKKPKIKAEIDKRMAEIEAKTDITVKFIQDRHLKIFDLAIEKGDLASANAALTGAGKTIAAYADKSYNLDVIEHNPQSLMNEEDILRKRLAMIEAAKALPSGIEGRQ